jgi:hypothetical protein
MRLVIERPAIRRLNDMPKAIRESIRRRLDEISADPFAKHPNVTRYKEGGPRLAKALRVDIEDLLPPAAG